MTNRLTDTLRPRVQMMAESIANILFENKGYYGGTWRGYKQSEMLEATLVNDTDILWKRKGKKATLWTRGITPASGDITITDRTTIATDLIDRYNTHFYVPIEEDGKPGGVKEITKKISHTFQKLTTHEEAFEQALQIQLEQTLQVGSQQLTFANSILKATEQFKASWQQKYGSSETQSDTVETTITVVPPVNVVYDAVRRREKVEVSVSGVTDFEFAIEFYDDTQIGEAPNVWQTLGWQAGPERHSRISLGWSSFAEFIRTASGNAPVDRNLAPQYTTRPEADGVIAALKKSPTTTEFTYIEDNVNSMDISAKPSDIVPRT